MKKYVDIDNKFIDFFNEKNGHYYRTGILKNGKDTGIDPFMRNYPSLLDVGIMGNCKNADKCDVGCYQGKKKTENMTLDNFKKIIDQSKGKTWEVALGGFGSPNEHMYFMEIVKYARENGIVPNYTTSGIELTNEQIDATKKYCGAVAVSWYRKPYTITAIEKFLEADVTTNIHYVLGKDSIDEAIYRIKNNDFIKGINAVLFLLYKPVGCIKPDNMLTVDDPRVEEFYKAVDEFKCDFQIGLDACNLPGVINFSKKINLDSTTPCDGTSFSAYITTDMKMLPCSFDSVTRNYAVDLDKYTMEEAWNHENFEKFRNYHRNTCKGCDNQNECRGGCPLKPEINLCRKEEKDFEI